MRKLRGQEKLFLPEASRIVTGNAFVEYFSPLTEKLKGLLSENLYSEFEELLFSCCAKNNDFYMTEGAKLAIEIMKGSYIPKV